MAAENGILEIRTYALKPGAGAEYERLFREDVGPMLARYGISVVGFGPSLDEADSFVLLRSFPSLAARDEQEERFYGSDEWLRQWRRQVLDLIDTYHTVVLSPGPDAVAALAAALAPGRGGVGGSTR